MRIQMLQDCDPEVLGLLPYFISDKDERTAKEQFNANYQFGGFDPFEGFELLPNGVLKYPEDPPLKPLAVAKLKEETIYFYQYAWVSIVQPDGTFEVARMD